jgi:hypothetical protein
MNHTSLLSNEKVLYQVTSTMGNSLRVSEIPDPISGQPHFYFETSHGSPVRCTEEEALLFVAAIVNRIRSLRVERGVRLAAEHMGH